MTAIPKKTLERAYDFIVVGSGSGGCPVVRRLIDGSEASVLLIEAGPSSFGVAEIEDPTAWVGLGRGAYDWGYNFAPTPRVNNRVIGIPAIWVGRKALHHIDAANGALRGRWAAWTGIVLGCVGVALTIGVWTYLHQH